MFFWVLWCLSCASSPTGRWQLMMRSNDSMNEAGEEAFEQIKSKIPIDGSYSTNSYVKCISYALINAIDQDTEELGIENWEIVVFKKDAINAFALPGGKIGVFTGIFQIARNKNQLAAVIGHEISHVLARHSHERSSQGIITAGFSIIVGIITGIPIRAISSVSQLGLLPFSRTHESEADEMGMDLMARAGFDPHGAVQVWQNMADARESSSPELLSTHPSDETRIEKLEENLDYALDLYQSAGNRPSCSM
ncbi:MAG: M48 family metallopeptidase [Leptospiraceae bacterium]|nr:M48 family metallopeptidase [Leptospiraceae bacterium]MCP5497950.1 M48 family metallopeptidase [Leptospiraceae bacterium]